MRLSLNVCVCVCEREREREREGKREGKRSESFLNRETDLAKAKFQLK